MTIGNLWLPVLGATPPLFVQQAVAQQGASPQYDSVVLADSPQAYWKLGEANGASTVADATGNGFTATASGSPSPGLGQSTVPGNLSGTSLGLSGSGSQLYTISPSGALLAALQNHDFSIEAWVLRSTAMSGSTPNVIFDAGASGTTDQLLQFHYQSSNFYLGFWGDDWSTGSAPSQSAWHHVVFTFKASTKVGTLYVDGVSVGSHTYTGTLNVGSSDWAIGGNPQSLGWNGWNGDLSRIAIYNYVLASTQVAKHYASVAANVPIQHNTSAGNYLIGVVGLFNATSVGAVTDTQGNSWSVDVQPSASFAIRCAIIRAKLITALTTADQLYIPLVGSGAAVDSVQMLEFTGSRFAASPLDASSTNEVGSGSTSLNTGTTGTLAQAHELAVSGCTLGGGLFVTTWTPPGGWTEVPIGLTDNIADAAYLEVNATTALNPTWTQTQPNNMAAAIATYKLL